MLVDMIEASRHDVNARHDHATLAELGVVIVRDGLRGHLIETAPGVYDWSSLERQLAAQAATDAVRTVDPLARFVHADPVPSIVANPHRPWEARDAEGHRLTVFQGWDMLYGLMWPMLGERPDKLDIVGVDFYSNTQWIDAVRPSTSITRKQRLTAPLLGRAPLRAEVRAT